MIGHEPHAACAETQGFSVHSVRILVGLNSCCFIASGSATAKFVALFRHRCCEPNSFCTCGRTCDQAAKSDKIFMRVIFKINNIPSCNSGTCSTARASKCTPKFCQPFYQPNFTSTNALLMDPKSRGRSLAARKEQVIKV